MLSITVFSPQFWCSADFLFPFLRKMQEIHPLDDESTVPCTIGQIIDFMVHLAVQTSPACFVVFNTQFDVNLKTFYIILLHTCKHTACQTKCGVMNVISFLRAAGMQNSWEGIYLCQHGRRADYCRRWGRKVRVWICQRKGGRETSCHWPKALGTHDSWIKFNLWVNPDFNRVNAFAFILTFGLFPNSTMRFECV